MRRPMLFGACALVVVNTVNAQDTASEQVVEQIVVTGTSIRGVASAGAPVIALDREALAATGLATSSDLARALPQVLSLGADESRLGGAQDGAANSTRISAINLRGIGNEATLLLINGRRLAPAGIIKSLYDPNVIASAAIERLEVVVDGGPIQRKKIREKWKNCLRGKARIAKRRKLLGNSIGNENIFYFYFQIEMK